MPSKHTIESWEWDDRNLGYLRKSGINRRRVLQIAEEAPRFRRNKRERSASHVMIGPDNGGTMWVVCIVEVRGKPGLWRAFNAWLASDEEKQWYTRQHGRAGEQPR